jgi:Replication-relaxation
MTSHPERLGRRGLVRLSDTLSQRDRQVLSVVAAHRFLTTRQIEAFCFTDHVSALAAARGCRRVLARLHELRVLNRLERRIGGVRAGSASFVWTVGPVGDRLLRDGSGQPRRRWHEPSATFLDHALAVADTHLRLRRAAGQGAFDLVGVDLEPACWRSYLNGAGGSETLRPDLYVVTASDAYEHCWFIEVDRGSESLPRLLSKCGQYEAYRRSGREQQRTGTFPLVLWVFPDERRAAKLQRAIATAPRLDPQLFRCVVGEQHVETIAGGAA